MNEHIRSQLILSMKNKYLSEIQECKATLLIYFNNPVAIGEHPQHLEEIDKLLEKAAAAKDKLQFLLREVSYFENTSSQ